MSENVKSRDEWILDSIGKRLTKRNLIDLNVKDMLNKSLRMFKYNGLPETIPQKDLELQLQVGGFSTFAEAKGDLYTFRSGLGGRPNPYYLPTISIVANPALNFNKELKIDEDCVVMRNDELYLGLIPLFNKYATFIAEAEISLKQAIINARVPALIQADNDNSEASAREFLKKITDGDDYGVIASNEFFEGIKTHDFFRQSPIRDLIETIQYYRGSWFNSIGIQSTFNMKREALNSAETALNDDILYPTIDTMLECRRIGLEKVNKMFGTNITVELDSVWKQNREQEKLDLELKEAEIDTKTSENNPEESKGEGEKENENS